MRIKKLIAASAAVVMLASNQTAMAGVSYAAEAVAESQIVYGEVNGDGKVSLSDAVAILQYIANRDKYPLSAKALLNADCVDHGDGVTGMDALALKLIDANMLKVEDLPVTSQKIQECLNPHTSEEALLFDEVYTFGVYNTETKSIDIEWLVNETVNEVEIFVSDDNQKYVSVAIVKDESNYSYEIKEDFDTKFFKVSYTDKDGKLHESFPFFIIAKDDKYVTEYLDTDEDGVYDMFESAYGSKIDEADSDKDGLSDYEEINFTKTDPTVSDSFKKGVSDSDADCDEDGISNITEIKNGTNPIRKDTDYDGLTDLEEMNELKTNPLVGDTDKDGLSDYAEIKMGLDPLNSETNGIPDAKFILDQKISSDAAVFEDINGDDNNKVYKLSVDIKTAGFAEENISVIKSRYSDSIKESSLVGDIIDIEIEEDIEISSMKLNFNINDDYRKNLLGTYSGLEGIKRFTVFQYNEDIHILIPMDTEYYESDGIVSAEIPGTGTYCIVDSEYWFDSIGIEPAEDDSDITEAPNDESIEMSLVADTVIGDNATLGSNEPFIAIFMLQRSGYGQEGNKNFLYEKKLIHDVGKFLFENYDGVGIYLIPYDINVKPIDTYNKCITDLLDLDSALDKIVYDNNTGYADRWTGYEMVRVLKQKCINDFIYKKITVNFLNSDSKFDNLNGETIYTSSLVMDPFGQIYYTEPSYYDKELLYIDPTTNKSEYREGLAEGIDPDTNYNHILRFFDNAVIPYNNYKVSADVCNIYGLLKGELSSYSNLDSDKDGLYDWDELDSDYVNLNTDGTYSFMTHSEVFKKENISIGKNGKNTPSHLEDTPYGPQLESYYAQSTLAVWHSDPTLIDSDGDDIIDIIDPQPKSNFRKAYVFNGKPSYELTKTHEDIETNDLLDILDKEADNTFDSDDVLSPFETQGIRAVLTSCGGNLAGFKNASRFLKHFLDKSGKDLNYDATQIVTCTDEGENSYFSNVRTMMQLCEDTVANNCEQNFKTPSNASLLGPKFSQTNKGILECMFLDDDDRDKITQDWHLSIGDASAAISVKCKRTGNSYEAVIKYYILDYYDWEPNATKGGGLVSDGDMYKLHVAGDAREFRTIGLYETTLKWNQGQKLRLKSDKIYVS